MTFCLQLFVCKIVCTRYVYLPYCFYLYVGTYNLHRYVGKQRTCCHVHILLLQIVGSPHGFVEYSPDCILTQRKGKPLNGGRGVGRGVRVRY